MARFVVARRRLGVAGAEDDLRPRGGFGDQLHSPFGTGAPSSDMSAFQAGLRASIVEAGTAPIFEAPDTIVEEEIVHWPEVVLPPDWPANDTAVSFPLASGPIATIAIFVTGGGLPLADAVVRLSVQGPSGPSGFRATTDPKGSCTFALPAGYTPNMALVCPAGGFWPMLVRGSAFAVPIECPALPADGPLGWWHTALGLDAADQTLGQGIRIGVVDTGAGPHACLQHVSQWAPSSRGTLRHQVRRWTSANTVHMFAGRLERARLRRGTMQASRPGVNS